MNETCSQFGADMKKMFVKWQRLVNEEGATCERCSCTGSATERAIGKLGKVLAPLGIEVSLEKAVLDQAAFSGDPLQSNRIWINGRPLEDWVGGGTGQSQCCDACGDSQCRTLELGEETFEAVPEELILKAGLLAAAEMLF